MSKPKKKTIDYRNYDLEPNYPILLLSGDEWRISDIHAPRLHFHNCLEIGFCEEGCGTIEFANRKLDFQAGDTTLIGSDIIHTTYSNQGTTSKWSYMFIDVEKFFYPYFSLDFLTNRNLIQEIIHSYSCVFTETEFPNINSQIKLIIHTIQQKETNYKFAVFGLLLSFLVTIMNIYRNSSETDAIQMQTPGDSLSIAPALDYIRKNYMQSFSMTDLADLCGMSPTHFRRTFSSVMKTGALEYLIRIRIERASLLLQTTDMPILNISEEVGFHSLSSFNRHFSNIIGESPREWRNKRSLFHNLSIMNKSGWMTPEQPTTK